MDPRNPLGRLDRLSRRPEVREVTVRLRHDGDTLDRAIEVELLDGRRRTFRLGAGRSWVDLLDRTTAFLDATARGGPRSGGAAQ